MFIYVNYVDTLFLYSILTFDTQLLNCLLFQHLVPAQLFEDIINGITISISLQQYINENDMVPHTTWLHVI